MDIWTIVNSAPVGVILGIVVTKTFDLLNKRVEFKQEAKLIMYREKIKTGSTAVKCLQSNLDPLYKLKHLCDSALINEDRNEDMYKELESQSIEELKEIESKISDMFNEAHFYYDFRHIDKKYQGLDVDIIGVVSSMANMKESDDDVHRLNVLKGYYNIIEKSINRYEDIIRVIVNSSKK